MIINIILTLVIIAGIIGLLFCLDADKKNQNKVNDKSKSKSKLEYKLLALIQLLINHCMYNCHHSQIRNSRRW